MASVFGHVVTGCVSMERVNIDGVILGRVNTVGVSDSSLVTAAFGRVNIGGGSNGTSHQWWRQLWDE